jgi:multidrug efflux pump subunit AcrB
MKLSISSWSIKNPTPVILLSLIALVIGMLSYLRLPITGNPKVELPIVQVDVAQPGGTPEELEQNIAKRLENGFSGLPGLKNLSTTITPGIVSVTLEFRLETELDRAVSDVRESVSRLRAELPQNITEPVVTRIDAAGGNLMTYVVRASGLSELALSRLMDEELSPRLLRAPGVQQFKRTGGASREFRIELDPATLTSLNLSALDVITQLRSAEQNLPAGEATLGEQRLSLRVQAASVDSQALGAREIRLKNGSSARLDQLGTILLGPSESSSFALYNGEPVTLFDLTATRGASEISVRKQVQAVLAQFSDDYPAVRFENVFDGAEYTEQSFNGARETLIEGALLTVLIVFWFLRDWRATFIAAAAIPLSLIPTFAAMHISGFYLDAVSLIALILVIGILVDDAIVEVENISARMEKGESAYQASMIGAEQIGLAVAAISFVIVAVFMPVSFIPGVIGKYFREFGLTTSFAVLASLAVARCITPLMCAYGLKAHARKEDAPRWLSIYEQVLHAVLNHPRKTWSAALVALLVSLVLLAQLPVGFLPKTRSNYFSVTLTIAENDAAKLAQKAEQLRASLVAIPDIRSVTAISAQANSAYVRIALRAKRAQSRDVIAERVRASIAQLIDVKSSFEITDNGKEFRMDFESSDSQALAKFIDTLTNEALQIPQLRDIETTRAPSTTVVDIRALSKELARVGLSSESLANQLRVYTLSDLDASLARVPIEGELVPIRARLAGGSKLSLDTLKALPIDTETGTVSLASIAELTLASASSRVDRFNRKATVGLSANLSDIGAEAAKHLVMKLSAFQNRDASIRISMAGDAELIDEMFTGFGTAMLLGLLAVYAILVLLFHDWLQPFTIMSALPLSLGGAAIALLLFGHELNLSTLIGLLMLFGIVAKNSILLVDFIVEARAAGSSLDKAVIDAGLQRARPIVMTTMAMVGGMVPTAIGFGSDDGFRAPMAVAVIGGLLSSTLLSLVFVPFLYSAVDRFKQRLRRRFTARMDAAHALMEQS